MKENFENVKELIIKLRERFSILNTKMQVVQLDFREGVILQINESKNSNSAFTDKLRNLHHANHKIHADRNLTAVMKSLLYTNTGAHKDSQKVVFLATDGVSNSSNYFLKHVMQLQTQDHSILRNNPVIVSILLHGNKFPDDALLNYIQQNSHTVYQFTRTRDILSESFLDTMVHEYCMKEL